MLADQPWHLTKLAGGVSRKDQRDLCRQTNLGVESHRLTDSRFQSALWSKVLVIGSGPIIIGQAAEFDYAGTQACKALREEGVTTVLVNSNPATIMTDEDIADIVYIEPLTVEVLERIIAQERPDGVLPTLGGQTGLNLAVELADAGILDKYDVRLLGTPLETIRNAEDRELFRNLLVSIGEPVPPSEIAESIEDAYRVMDDIGLPLVIRPAYTRWEVPEEASQTRSSSSTRSSEAGWPRVPSARCWSRSRSSAGRRSSTR